MAKDSNWVETLLKGAAMIGGMWLSIELIKALSKKKVMYRCPNCRSLISFRQTPCPYCDEKLRWKIRRKRT